MAESEGFEPPDLLQSTVFKTAAFDHSASSPVFCLVVSADDFYPNYLAGQADITFRQAIIYKLRYDAMIFRLISLLI